MDRIQMKKGALRTQIKEKRRTRGQLSITAHLLTHPIYQGADMVFLYAATPYEVDVTLVAENALSMGKIVAFPRSHPDGTLTFHEVKDLSSLTKGAFGIGEPPMDAPVVTGNPTSLLLVPGLAFDETGNRLGHGRGYYDRYLAHFKGTTLGVVRKDDLFPTGKIPVEEHDLAVTYLATEHEIIQTRKSYDTGF